MKVKIDDGNSGNIPVVIGFGAQRGPVAFVRGGGRGGGSGGGAGRGTGRGQQGGGGVRGQKQGFGGQQRGGQQRGGQGRGGQQHDGYGGGRNVSRDRGRGRGASGSGDVSRTRSGSRGRTGQLQGSGELRPGRGRDSGNDHYGGRGFNLKRNDGHVRSVYNRRGNDYLDEQHQCGGYGYEGDSSLEYYDQRDQVGHRAGSVTR